MDQSGAIKASSRETFHQELDLGSPQHCHWHKKCCLFKKIFRDNKPFYLSNLIPTKNLIYNSSGNGVTWGKLKNKLKKINL